MITMSLLYLACILVVANAQESSGPIETITTGRVLGKRMTVFDKQIDAFLGIPFAEPVSGERRFSLPEQKAPWGDELFDATNYGDGCWQVPDSAFPGFEGTEIWNPAVELSDDCLNLNVWVPNPRPSNSAVLVWIFGGSFWYGVGSLSLYDGKYLAAEENIIVVTMNYRVSSFGFLATGHESAPGNQGLYDQQMALQWVRDNIAVFGGDPAQVTLFGESAGGASVAFHMLSPMSQPLFQRAGIQSAGPTARWASMTQEEGLRRSKLLGEALGCNSDDIPDMVTCLQNVDATELAQNSWVTGGFLNFPFVPVYDGVFLPEDPVSAVQNGNFKDCELIIGSNTNEAFFFIIYEVPGFSKDTDSLLDYDAYIEALTYQFPFVNSFGLEAIAFQYRPWQAPHDQALLRDATDLAQGDYSFTCPSVDFAMAYAKADNHVYYYRFEERASNSAFADWMGVLHGDEIAYIFGIPLNESWGYSEQEQLFSRKLMKYWANFAKTGNPNSDMSGVSSDEWPQYKMDTQEYLVLNESLVDGPAYTGSEVKPLQCAFWKEYIPQLVTKTADINEVEIAWKEEFSKWSNEYIVDWKVQFDKYTAEANSNDPE